MKVTAKQLMTKAAAATMIAEAALTKAAEEVNLSRLQRKQAEAEIPATVEELVKAGLVTNTPQAKKIASAALADPINALLRLKKLASMVSSQGKPATAPGDVVPGVKRANDGRVTVSGTNAFDEANEAFSANL